MNYRRSLVYSAPVPKMPPSLLELMEGLSKDVLRNNPTNIYEFCADHMEKLLQIRDNIPPRNVLTLEEKITKAQKIIRERAKKRRDIYDQMIVQQEIESKLYPNVDESPKFQQKMIIPEDVISNKQVELVDRSEVFNIGEQSKEIINKSNDDEYVRTLLIINSSENEQNVDKSESDRGIIINLKLEPSKYVQEEKKDDADKQNSQDMSLDTLENNSKNIIHCESTESNSSVKDVLKNPINDIDRSIENSGEKEIFEVNNFNEVEINTAPNTITISSCIGNQNNIATPRDLEANQSLESLELTSHPDALTSDINEEAVTQVIETKPTESIAKSLNGNERKIKQSSDDSGNSCGRQPENKVLTNNGNDTNTMDLETAAVTIQKVFRSFLFKCKTSSIDESTNVDINLFINDKDVKEDANIPNINKERRGISRMDTVLQTVNEEKSLSLSTEDSSTLSSAATVIQAHIRGFLVRNKLHINKNSSTSLHDSDAISGTSLEMDSDQQKGKTILNIHIVPERGHFISRDESLITSMDLSMDGSPRSFANLHPHSYDINERRKQLKREDAVQSVSPPSNNSSSKLSEDIDSVKECLVPDTSGNVHKIIDSEIVIQPDNDKYGASSDIQTAVESEACETSPPRSIEKLNTDEMDVVTPFNEQNANTESDNKKLIHSSEFHEAILPTQVSRTDTSVVREFHNVLAYFLIWN